MTGAGDPSEAEPGERPRSGFFRSLRLALVLLGLLVVGMAVASALMGEQSDLPFDYERFE
jgi:hypothetical protein